MTAALVTGLILRTLNGVGPLFSQLTGLNRAMLSVLMSVAIIGELVLQYPVGRFSDGRGYRSARRLGCCSSCRGERFVWFLRVCCNIPGWTVLVRMRRRPVLVAEEQGDFQIVPRTSPIAIEMDPRSEPENS